jgi:nitrile hydratase accessory protein
MNARLERPFDAPWQARAFAITLNLHEQGMFTWDEWSRALGEAISAAPDQSYYEVWLEVLQALVIERKALTPTEIADTRQAWLDAAARTPHGNPIELEPRS